MRVSEGNAGGWTGKAVRTTQTRDDGWHLVLGARTHTHTHAQLRWLCSLWGTQEAQSEPNKCLQWWALRGKTLMRNVRCLMSLYRLKVWNILKLWWNTEEECVCGCVCFTHCCACEGWAAFNVTVHVSRHTRAAGALIHLPLFIGVIYCSLVQTRRPWVYDTCTETHKHGRGSEVLWTNSTTDAHCIGWLWYLGIHSSISQESSLVSARPDKL